LIQLVTRKRGEGGGERLFLGAAAGVVGDGRGEDGEHDSIMRLGGEMVCNGWICFCGAGDEGAGKREKGRGKREEGRGCVSWPIAAGCLLIGLWGWWWGGVAGFMPSLRDGCCFLAAVPSALRWATIGRASGALGWGWVRSSTQGIFRPGRHPAKAKTGRGAHPGRGHILRIQGAPVHVAEAGILGMGRC